MNNNTTWALIRIWIGIKMESPIWTHNAIRKVTIWYLKYGNKLVTFSLHGLVLLGVLQGVLLLTLQVGIVLAPTRLRLICTNRVLRFIPVFRIRDILRWIRIRNPGSVYWITDPDPNPALFDRGSFKMQKSSFSPKFPLLITVLLYSRYRTLHQSSKITSH